MLSKTSDEFKSFFLLQFTKELIRNSSPIDILELKEAIKQKRKIENELLPKYPKEQKKEFIKSLIKSKERRLSFARKREFKKVDPFADFQIQPPKPFLKAPVKKLRPKIRKTIPAVLRIPKQRLPPRLQYIKPSPTKNLIDLGKLNPLIKDPKVRIIECNGPDKKIIVKGQMGTKPSNIILNKNEIEFVLETFSKQAKIPLYEGVFRVAIGNLILNAMVSNVVNSRFIIEKMSPYSQPSRTTLPESRGSMLIRR